MDTERLASFVATADTGALSRAAARLSQQVSTISRHVSDLEAELGVQLFERTGRGVRLTAAGARFLARSRLVLHEVEQARAEARGDAVEDATLRLSSPPDLAQHLVVPVLASVAARFPRVSFQSRSDVRRVSLVEEAYDAVVRLGPLSPSELLPRRLGTLTIRLYAPPGQGVDSMEALAGRPFVLVEGAPSAEVHARDRGRPVTFRPRGRLRVGSFSEAAAASAHSGALVMLPSLTALAAIRAGTLSGAARWLTFKPVEVHLLRTARHRGNEVLDVLAQQLSEALAAAEAAVA
ncbi:MAG: LysR family transcriptional regulator [Myxococcaceae bacterium]|nr:LysR family transcriptional regulator [Myxococcaceae bacterium]